MFQKDQQQLDMHIAATLGDLSVKSPEIIFSDDGFFDTEFQEQHLNKDDTATDTSHTQTPSVVCSSNPDGEISPPIETNYQ